MPDQDQVLTAVQELVADRFDAKTFSSGNRGYFAGGKVEAGGHRYQVTLNVVDLGEAP
jgi:hypothetical protein